MAPPVWIAAQVLTSADVNSWFVPLVAVKTTDQSKTSSTTLANDNELVLTLPASVTYRFECYLDYEGGTGGSSDLKWSFILPGTATLRYLAVYTAASGGTNVITTNRGSDTTAARSAGAGNLEAVYMNGTVTNGTTGGSLQLQWAQNTSSGTATVVHAQSYMSLRRFT